MTRSKNQNLPVDYVCRSFREFVSSLTNPCFEGKPTKIEIAAITYTKRGNLPVAILAVSYADYTEYVEVHE